ncbi:ankyrin [Polyplosphaeria fusca]|uniref:Ankyrin n=1 Tax=Polyplosphaeria fusca TaxID=682080 RepID=A0A9P4QU38_9PLEO|nr:ankyrin [Polyplosphaeria fusca]
MLQGTVVVCPVFAIRCLWWLVPALNWRHQGAVATRCVGLMLELQLGMAGASTIRRKKKWAVFDASDASRTSALEHKGPKLQTIIEVLRCEWARSGGTSNDASTILSPSKAWTPVHHAALHNREAALGHFLRAGQSPDGDDSVVSPLCVAVEAGNIAIVQMLCEAGANVKLMTEDRGETALHLAIKNGRFDAVDVILSSSPDLGARTTDTGETPLHYAAARTGGLAVVVNLLKSKANYESVDSNGRTAAEVAIQKNNIHSAVAIVNAARGSRRKLTKEKEMLLRHVEKTQNRFSLTNELIATLFEASCDPDSTVLIETIKRDDLNLATMFLERGADPNRPTQTGLRPIFAALTCSGAKMVQLLVKHGVDVKVRDAEGLTPLQVALECPSVHDKEAVTAISEALLSNEVDANVTYSDGKSILHQAVSLRLSRVAQLLIQHDVDVNAQDHTGSSALHVAGASKACLEVLLRNGADPSLTDYNGLTPLLTCISSATKESEAELEPLIRVSNLRALDSMQRTALHLAAQRGLPRTVRALLKCRAETTLIDQNARTPLLLAVLEQQWSVVPLLATQPGVNTWDKEGMTAIHHAVKSIPETPAQWKEIASAAQRFCNIGASRGMRDRSGATPLILAVKSLPEEGLPVVDVLLAGPNGGRSNCVDHEDHKQRSALHFAATMGKPVFVLALLKAGATFVFKDWTISRGPLKPNTAEDKQTLRFLAENEWMRRAIMLQRASVDDSGDPVLPKILPIPVLKDLLAMGLDPNALPFPQKTTYSGLLLWLILNQTLHPPPLPPKFLYDILKLLFTHGADANATAVHPSHTPRQPRRSSSQLQLPLGCHPLAFLLEHYPTVDIDLITLFLDSGSNLTTASPYYEGRYPLHSAVKANRMDVVDELILRKAYVNAVDQNLRGPLFIAAEQGFWEIADFLVQRGANVNAKDSEGSTVLHAAAKGGCVTIVRALLRAGAKANVKDKADLTPLSCIPESLEEKDKSKIAAILKHTEALERQEEELKAQRLKQQAIEEGKRKLKAEIAQRKASQESIKKAHDVAKKTPDAVKPTVAPAPTPAAPPVTPAPQPTQQPSKKTSRRFWPGPLAKPLLLTHASIEKLNALSPPPPPPKPQPQPRSAPTLPQVTLPNPTPAAQKTDTQPRVDSGFGYAAKDADTEKPVPVLDRSKAAFDGPEGQNGVEILDWLAVSRALDV